MVGFVFGKGLSLAMKKGCLIAAGAMFLVLCAAVAAIYLMAAEYEKRPKEPGEAELWAAEDFIQRYKGSEGAGNTPEARAFAESYGRKLRIARGVLFTEGKAGGVSLTKGYFLTYCFAGDDSLGVVVHVHELRRYAPDAQVTLGEYAWVLATQEAGAHFPQVKRLAVAVKGGLNCAAIFTGIVTEGDPITGVQERHSTTSKKPLYPFFTPKAEGDKKTK